MRSLRILACLGTLAGLAACGDTIEQQALIGGGAGAATALVVQGNPLVGAAAGAAGNMLYCQTNPGKC